MVRSPGRDLTSLSPLIPRRNHLPMREGTLLLPLFCAWAAWVVFIEVCSGSVCVGGGATLAAPPAAGKCAPPAPAEVTLCWCRRRAPPPTPTALTSSCVRRLSRLSAEESPPLRWPSHTHGRRLPRVRAARAREIVPRARSSWCRLRRPPIGGGGRRHCAHHTPAPQLPSSCVLRLSTLGRGVAAAALAVSRPPPASRASGARARDRAACSILMAPTLG